MDMGSFATVALVLFASAAGAAAVETSEQHAGRAVLFGGLSGDDDAPERLGDAWEVVVARDAA